MNEQAKLTSWFANLRIQTKLLGSFAVVVLLACGVGGLAIRQIHTLEDSVQGIVSQGLKPLELAGALQVGYAEVLTALRDLALAKDDAEAKAQDAELEAHIEANKKSLQELEAVLPDEASKAAFKDFTAERESYLQARGTAIRLGKDKSDGGTERAIAFIRSDMESAGDRIVGKLQAVRERIEAAADARVDAATDAARADIIEVAAMLGVAALVALGLGYLAARSVTKPLSEAVEVVEAFGRGDLTRRVPVTSGDEVGRMSAALNQALAAVEESLVSINHNIQTLASASEELSAVATQMGANAEETSAQAGTVSAAANQVSHNVTTVASATEEMGASIREIAREAAQAAKVAEEAMHVADEANSTILKLDESSAEIGKILKVITSIAEQTNLLSLNATIEAARAGDAGKGFAVVANEVKELAKGTAKATEDVAHKIELIQSGTQGAVTAIGQITGVVKRITDINGTIASAVEEQAATTSEIGRNVGEAAKGSGDIAQNITGVATAAQSTSSGAQHSQEAASELARMSAELQAVVSRFKVNGAAANAAPAAPAARSGNGTHAGNGNGHGTHDFGFGSGHAMVAPHSPTWGNA